jgi:hypothetical protein
MPFEEEAALHRLALWCTRYSPLVAPDPPDGIFIDIAGSAHLFKGEASLFKDLRERLLSSRISAIRRAVPGRSRVFPGKRWWLRVVLQTC